MTGEIKSQHRYAVRACNVLFHMVLATEYTILAWAVCFPIIWTTRYSLETCAFANFKSIHSYVRGYLKS